MEIYSICKRLKESRIKQGFFSARAFASHNSIPDSTYTQHESGKRKMSIETLIKYCKLLNIEPLWLITGKRGIKQSASLPTNLTPFSEDSLENLIIQNAPVKIDIELLSKIFYQTTIHCSHTEYTPHNILNSSIKIYNHIIKNKEYTTDPTIDSKIHKIIISAFYSKSPSYVNN